MPSEIPVEVRQEWTRLRAILYEPSSVWLATWAGNECWLTDQYVMLDVTSSCAFEDYDVPDGGYKLVASKGFEPKELGWKPDLDAYFAAMDQLADWYPVRASEWSVVEHPGKAQLWVSSVGSQPLPCLLGESTWSAIKRNHPGCLVEYSEETNVFRFTDERVFCFAAGIRVPDGQERMAKALAREVDADPCGTSHAGGHYPSPDGDCWCGVDGCTVCPAVVQTTSNGSDEA